MTDRQYTVGVVIFHEFELLDVFGPLEMLGMYPETFKLVMVAEQTGLVASSFGPKVHADASFEESHQFDILLVPGGRGTRKQVNVNAIKDWLIQQSNAATWVTSVCTGSAVLAAAGLLDGHKATTNKNSFKWVMSCSDKVDWQTKARWVESGKFITSSGVSAGTDMILSLIAKVKDLDAARQAAQWAEYTWNEDPDNDPFSISLEE